MQLAVLGLNHKTVPVNIREQFSISPSGIHSGLHHLDIYDGIQEAVILSTCNRTEIYAVLGDGAAGAASLKKFFLDLSGNSQAEDAYFYYYTDRECIRHLFEVSSSLDSLVIGESQILNQVKNAYSLALRAKSTGTLLNTLFHRAITTGKRVRAETHISYNAVSVSYAAVQLAQKVWGTLEGKTALIFGAGQMAELTVRNLVGKGLQTVFVANRHLDRAVKLAETLGGKAVPFDNALETSESADILITSTGSSQYIIQPWEARLLMVRRNQRPLVIIDIAVPRDVDPECGKIQGLQLYNIDDLEAVVADNIRFRQGEAEQARRIVQEELDALEERFQYLSCRPVMVSLSDKAEHIRKREIRRALSKLPDISDEEKRIMDHMTRMIVRKMLREPMMHLNESAGTDQESVYKSAVTSLFRLNVRKENLLAKSN